MEIWERSSNDEYLFMRWTSVQRSETEHGERHQTKYNHRKLKFLLSSIFLGLSDFIKLNFMRGLSLIMIT
jgi:hypothetical protein